MAERVFRKAKTKEQQEKTTLAIRRAKGAPTPAEAQKKIDAYFALCEETERIPNEFDLAKEFGVVVNTIRKWHDYKGDTEESKELAFVIQCAYDRMAAKYMQLIPIGKGVNTIVQFLTKQKRFGGYLDKTDTSTDTTVRIVHGDNVDMSDFK